MEEFLENIIESPILPKYLEELGGYYNLEQSKRQLFYDIITEDAKAEFINGEIFMHSPVRMKHLNSSDLLSRLISIYISKYKLGRIGIEKQLISFSRNDYEPDICFFKREKSDKFTKNQMKFPAPDFIVEILSESTEKNDRGIKFQDYALHGVCEYWIIDPETQIVEQYILENEEYILNQKSNNGIIKSIAIDGLELPIEAIFDENENLKFIEEILIRS